MNLKKYNRLKQHVERSQREEDRLRGALDQTMERLKKEFDCLTLKGARQKLAALEEKLAELKKRYGVALEQLEEEIGDKI